MRNRYEYNSTIVKLKYEFKLYEYKNSPIMKFSIVSCSKLKLERHHHWHTLDIYNYEQLLNLYLKILNLIIFNTLLTFSFQKQKELRKKNTSAAVSVTGE